jgi:hypothetical protein
MLNTKKRATALLAFVGVAAVIGIGGFAYAAFTQERRSEAIRAGTATFQNLVVTGAPAERSLWPGQTTDVTLTIDNTANNTPILVGRAEHVPVAAADVRTTDRDDAGYCSTQLELADFRQITGADAAVAAGAAETIVLEDALKLLPTADNRCQNMTFTVRWSVSADVAYAS